MAGGMMIFGLRGKLILALALMTLLTILCAAAVIYSLSRSVSSFDHVATTALPSLRIAERLARHSERAVAQIAILSAVRSEQDQQDLRNQWDDIDRALNAALNEARGLAALSSYIEDLTTQIGQIQTTRKHLDQAVGRRLVITSQQEKQREALLKESGKFQDILEPLIVIAERERAIENRANPLDARLITDPTLIEPAAGPALQDGLTALLQLRQMTSDIVNTMLAVEQENRPEHLQLAVIRTQSYADRVQALLSSLDRDAGRYLAGLTEQIRDLGNGPAGLPALRRDTLANEQRMAALRTEASMVIQQLEMTTDQLVLNTSSMFDEDQQEFRQTQVQMSLLVAVAAVLSILASLGIGTFSIQRGLVQPIIALSKSIKSFEQGGPVDGNLGQSKDEIGQLEKAFVDMACRRKQVETELAERNALLAATNGKLERANTELERSNQELDSFAYIAAHDLKEPLRAIRNHAGFLVEDYGEQIGDDGTKRLNRMVELAGRMDQLIADLLHYARLGRGEQAVEPIDPKGLIEEIEADLADTLKARGARIVLQDHLPSIKGNKSQIATVFRNLISNGTKYNDADDKVVEIGIDPDKQHEPSSGSVTFYVRDNGIGIDGAFRDDVFKIFKRLNSEKAYGGGTGAGLSFVKKIIENQGGRIWLESKPGNGTTFFFTLRRAASSNR